MHRFETHTGEVQIRLAAPDLPGLFVAAAEAFAELVAERVGPERAEPWHVDLREADREALLVRWLDELVYRADRHGEVPRSVQVAIDGDHLAAEVRLGPIVVPRTEVKAATYHGLAVRAAAGQLEATVVVDV